MTAPPATAWPAAPRDDSTAEPADGSWVPPTPPPHAAPPYAAAPPPPRPPRQRRPFSWALTLLTFSVGAIALAVLYLVSEEPLRWTAYVALALGVTAVALLVGTVVGNAGPLIPVGLVLVLMLAVGSVVPSLRAGDVVYTPRAASEVRTDYTVGMGRLTLDLRDVDDLSALEGRTVNLRQGLGETLVVVPEDLEVALDADVLAGGVDFLDDLQNGTRVEVRERSAPTGPVLTLDVEQSLGQVTVVRR